MFIAYDISLEVIAQLRVVMPAIKRVDRNLADQITRAATSVTLNLAEGRRRSGGDQRRFWEFAQGSASEIEAALAVGVAWGWLDVDAELHALVRRLQALLWGLTHPRAAREAPQ